MRKTKAALLCGLLLCMQFLWAQTTVTGRVTDARDNSALAGVTVTVKNTNLSTVTGTEGTFNLTAPEGSTLVFSYTGYQAVERVASGTMDVALERGENNLQEVVVTGYLTQTRRQSPGSISRIRADEVRLQPVGSFEQQLQGKSPGVLIQAPSGQPGSAASVTIRGRTSVLGSTQPLYIVDGIQINDQDFQSLNPSDFETFNILKDAVATAQYGSRGANGVIVITTKKGANAKTRVTYDYQYGVGELPENKLKLMNAAEKIAFELAADGIYGTNPNGWSDEEADSLSKVQADWAGTLFRKAKTNQHQLSLSGGNERTRFFISGSVFDQEGVVVSTGLKRYTGRVNLDHTVGAFKLGLSGFVGSSKFTNTSEATTGIGSPLNAIRWHLPYVTPYLPDGSYNQADNDIQGQPNALQELLENPRQNQQLKGIGTVNLEYRAPFLPGLTARTNWGVDFTDNTNQRYISPETYLGSQQTGSQGSFQQSNNRNRRFTGTTSLGYRRQAGDHGFSINLFNEYIKNRFDSFGFVGYGLVGAFKNASGIIPGTPTNGFIPNVQGNESASSLLSYFAIADYNFRNKYFLNGTVRRDGASKLAEGKKWTTFGGIGASWAISAEDFMANSKTFSDLRLRASYGSAANSNVGEDYEALEQFGPTSYNGVGGLVLTNFRKPNLTWENRTTLNLGLDFGLLQNRVSGTIEVYDAVTKGLYLNRQISGTSGATSVLTNLGRLRNRGIEASITAAIVKSSGFNWTLSANHTFNKSRVLELDATEDNINGLFINRVGERQNSLYVVRYAGVDPESGNPLYLTKDGKTTDVYDPNDRVVVGTTDPPHFGGVTNTFSFKGLELGVLFSYVFGNKVYNNDRTNVENPYYYYSSASRDLLKTWTKAGDITEYPSLVSDYHPETTFYVEKGDFVRLRNVMLSYTLPATIAGKIRANTLRVFAQGQNLITWHHVKAYDPEVPSGNLLGAQYPPLKTITFGLTLGF
jgi:TonB-linked SusC/RagA family outer membrane protein